MGVAVAVELEKPRRLRFDVNALSDAEEALGMSLGALMQSQMGIRPIRTLLWAGLKWEDRGLTEERVGALIQARLESGGTLDEIAGWVARALSQSGLFKGADAGNATAEAAQA